MNCALRTLVLSRVLPTCHSTATDFFSTSACALGYKKYKRRWVNTENWPKNRVTDETWAPNVPMEQNNNPWSPENAYFGTYDFMDILGNDVTMEPALLCKGPSYLRGKRLMEVQMLLNRRKQYGARMHAEDLNQTDKRIKYLLTVYNRRKKNHG
ncbi:large ribosomal subunit protein mL51-like [Styela clava]|uniref:39S ribosomal protein L51, mitochondrial-like n=1 Tax=Styela clava TaxID=7725 RepID=UPI0019399D46|nr:39S ribosomal protein L51, mitochondrial-like [Styela clava]